MRIHPRCKHQHSGTYRPVHLTVPETLTVDLYLVNTAGSSCAVETTGIPFMEHTCYRTCYCIYVPSKLSVFLSKCSARSFPGVTVHVSCTGVQCMYVCIDILGGNLITAPFHLLLCVCFYWTSRDTHAGLRMTNVIAQVGYS